MFFYPLGDPFSIDIFVRLIYSMRKPKYTTWAIIDTREGTNPSTRCIIDALCLIGGKLWMGVIRA